MSEVKLSKSEYEKMVRQISKLSALEAGGVDNWEWYDESLKDWHKENDLNDLIFSMCDWIYDASIDAEVDYPAGRECGPSISITEEAALVAVRGIIKQYEAFIAE